MAPTKRMPAVSHPHPHPGTYPYSRPFLGPYPYSRPYLGPHPYSRPYPYCWQWRERTVSCVFFPPDLLFLAINWLLSPFVVLIFLGLFF